MEQNQVSFIERCPLFRGSFIRGSTAPKEVGVREQRKKGGMGKGRRGEEGEGI